MSFSFFFLIIGTRFFNWGSETTGYPIRCQHCGTYAPFTVKKGMQFITVFFIIPVIPISGFKYLLACPTCKTKYSMPNPPGMPPGTHGQGPY